MMIYRQLPPVEWERLLEYFTACGHPEYLPDPATAIAIVAEEDGMIMGVLMQQICWHREPLIVNTPRVSFVRLNDAMNEAFREFPKTTYFALTDNPDVIRMAHHVGMTVESTLTVLKGSN